jgi:hypothetical protein
MIDSPYLLGAVASTILVVLAWVWIKTPPPLWVILVFVAASPFLFYYTLIAGADPRFIAVVGITYAIVSIVLLGRGRGRSQSDKLIFPRV